MSKDQSSPKVAARLRAALELHRSAVRMMRCKLEREHPDESREQITHRLNDWLQSPLSREDYLRSQR